MSTPSPAPAPFTTELRDAIAERLHAQFCLDGDPAGGCDIHTCTSASVFRWRDLADLTLRIVLEDRACRP